MWIVTDAKVFINDASRPWKVMHGNRVIARYATKAQAQRRANDLNEGN